MPKTAKKYPKLLEFLAGAPSAEDYMSISWQFGRDAFSIAVDEAEKADSSFAGKLKLQRRQRNSDGSYEIDLRESGAFAGINGCNLLGFMEESGKWERGRNREPTDIGRVSFTEAR